MLVGQVQAFAVVAHQRRKDNSFAVAEAQQGAVQHQVFGVFVVIVVADLHANIVQDRGVLQ